MKLKDIELNQCFSFIYWHDKYGNHGCVNQHQVYRYTGRRGLGKSCGYECITCGYTSSTNPDVRVVAARSKFDNLKRLIAEIK